MLFKKISFKITKLRTVSHEKWEIHTLQGGQAIPAQKEKRERSTSGRVPTGWPANHILFHAKAATPLRRVLLDNNLKLIHLN